jgi:hypothetical protein
MQISEYINDKPDWHWEEISQPLHLYKYTSVYDDYFYKSLKSAVLSRIENKTTDLTYLTHGSTFNFNQKKMHILSHKQNHRIQDVVYDLTFVKDYWYQTKNTIYEWAWDYLKKNIHPIFYKHLINFKNITPHSDEPGLYIPYRWHLNWLNYTEYLHLHVDSCNQYFNTPLSNFARHRSLTFYLHDHIPGTGGELYFTNGLIYHPKENEGVLFNGTGVLHGVNSNMNPDKKPRLAFTTRWAHKDDLYLPGDPENAMYKINLL